MSKRQQENTLRKASQKYNKTYKAHKAHIEDLKKKIAEADANRKKATNADGKKGWLRVATANRRRLEIYTKRTADMFSEGERKEFNKSIGSQLKIIRQKR